MNIFLRLFAGLLLIMSAGISCNQQSPAESSGASDHPGTHRTLHPTHKS